MNPNRTVAIGDVLTADQVKCAHKIYRRHRGVLSDTALVDELERKITGPAIPQINERTGQQNDARYWAYALVFVLRTLNAEGSRC